MGVRGRSKVFVAWIRRLILVEGEPTNVSVNVYPLSKRRTCIRHQIVNARISRHVLYAIWRSVTARQESITEMGVTMVIGAGGC